MTLEMFMKEAGYSEQTLDPVYGHDGVVYWYRKVPETERHQYVVRMWPALKDGFMPKFEVEMVYETKNGIWAETKFYGLTFTQLVASLQRLEGRLKQSLLYMDANPLHYQYEGE